MMPPTSIDGTDITGATIDGQDVQEITVDGDTVFTAGSPVLNTTIFQNADSYFKMSTGSGTTLVDSVGSNDATVSNLSWGSGEGLEDSYADFSSNISGEFSGSASDWSGLVNNAEGSVGFFINVNDTSGKTTIAGENIGAGLMWTMFIEKGKMTFRGFNDPDLWFVETSISSGSWHSVVGTCDSSTNTAELYIDKVQLASDSTSTGNGNLYKDIAIGAEVSQNRRFLDGYIDSLFYSDSHSTQSDITEWHDAHAGLYP